MAHPSKFEPDPARVGGESDLADLAAKFAEYVSPELSTDLALEIVLHEIVKQACLATGAGGAAIVLNRGREWICRATAGESAPQLGARLDAETGLLGACVNTRKLQRCDDAQTDPRADVEACRTLGVRSVIILPLLRNDELAGLFEALSAEPSAFGDLDVRALEALSLRVLKNLVRAEETLSASMQATPAPLPTVENSAAESVVAKSIGGKNLRAAFDADNGSLDRQQLKPASGAAFFRGINLFTYALAAAVLAFAVLLTVRVVQRLGGGKIAAHPPAAAGLSGGENQSAGASKGAAKGGASVNSENQSDASRSSAAPLSGAASVPSAAGAAHTTVTLPPGGSLLVYDNGREVFRIPPTVEQAEAASGGDTRGTGVQRESSVEPGIDKVSQDVAEGSLVHRVEPEYPEEARRERIQGQVVLEVRAGGGGGIEEVKLLSGQRLLADAAIAAVKQWRFRPHMVKGQAAEMQTKVTLNFRLPAEGNGRQ